MLEAHPFSHYSPSPPTSHGRAEAPYLRENISPTNPSEMHLLKPGMSLHLPMLTRAMKSPGKANVGWVGDKEMGCYLGTPRDTGPSGPDPFLRVTGTFGLLPMPDTTEEILRQVSSRVTEDKH